MTSGVSVPARHPGLDTAIPLVDEELVVIASLDHPLTRSKRVRVARLADEPLVTYAAGSALRDTLVALVPGGRVVAEANDLETVRELTARGLGVTVMPRSVAVWHRDRLAIRPLSPRSAVPVSLIWRAGERPTPAAQAFRAHLMSAMGQGSGAMISPGAGDAEPAPKRRA